MYVGLVEATVSDGRGMFPAVGRGTEESEFRQEAEQLGEEQRNLNLVGK